MKLTKIALGVALAAGAVSAQADALFFPAVVVSPSVTTIVSVIHQGATVTAFDESGSNAPAGKVGYLHWQYVRKDYPALNDSVCTETDHYLPTSAKDVQTVDLAGKFSDPAVDKGVLFNDPNINNPWRSSTWDYALGAPSVKVGGSRGYLIVHDQAVNTLTTTLSGYAMNYDFGSGAAWGYKAYPFAHADYGLDSHVFAPVQVHLNPFGEMITRFFVTPTPDLAGYAALTNKTNADFGKLSATVTLDAGGGSVAFNRDEAAKSGDLLQEVVCTGVVDATELIDPTSLDYLKDGGWSNLVSAAGTANPGAGAAIFELEIGGQYAGKGTFNGHSVSGTFNNAFKLQ